MKDKEVSNNFIKNFAGFSFGPIISAVIGFLTVPLTTWLIEPSMFGKASMFVTAQSLVSLMLFLGFDQAFVREYREVDDKKNLLYNSLLLPVLFSLVLLTIIIIKREYISLILFSETDFLSIIILAVSIPILIYKRFGLLLLRMEEKGLIYSLIQILEKVIYLIILIPVFLFWERSYRSIIISSFGMIIIMTLVELIITRKYWFKKVTLDKKLLKRMSKFGIPLIPVGILVWVMNSMDKVSLRIWSDFNEIGLYAGAFKIVLVMDIIKRSFSNFWVPVSYRWYNEKVSIKKFETVNRNLSAFLSLVFALIVISRNIIILMLDPLYSSSASLVPFLLFVPIMYTLSETTVLGIAFSRRTVFNLYITIIVAIINLSGNIYLVPRFGALGAAIATAFSYILFFILRSIIGNRLWEGISLRKGFINLALLVLLSGLTLFNIFYLEIAVTVIIIFVNYREYRYITAKLIDFVKIKKGNTHSK